MYISCMHALTFTMHDVYSYSDWDHLVYQISCSKTQSVHIATNIIIDITLLSSTHYSGTVMIIFVTVSKTEIATIAIAS